MITLIGGGAYWYMIQDDSAGAGGALTNRFSSPTVTNCTFAGNSASANGGAMFGFATSLTVTDCTFSGNTATGRGGAMFHNGGSPTLTGCTFSENATDENATEGGPDGH